MNIINDSFIVKYTIYIMGWFKKLFSNSRIIQFFASPSKLNLDKHLNDSLIYKFFIKIITVIKSIIYKLKLDEYLRNSIFTNSMFWICVTIVGILIFPTYVLSFFGLISFCSFCLKCCVDDSFQIRKNNIDIFVLGFITCVMVSILLTKNFSDLILYFLVLILFLSNYFVVVNSIRCKKDWELILRVFLVSGLIACIYGIYQYFLGNLSLGIGWIDPNTFNNIDKRMIGTFNNPIIFGEYLIFYVLISFGYFIKNKGVKKIFPLVCLILSSVCIFLTFSRACFLGLLVSVFILLVVFDNKNIIWFLILMLVGFLVLPDNIIDRIVSITNFSETSISHRFEIWNSTLSILKDYWLIGIGFGDNSFIRISTYYCYTYFYMNTEHSHNLILTLFTSYGFFGFLTYMMMIIYYFKRGLTYFVRKKDYLLLSILCGFIGLLVIGVFDYTLYNYPIILLQFIIMGLSMGITNLLEDKEYEK